jgi:uncharacterized membrane protein
MAGVGLLLRRLNPYQSFGGWVRVYGAAAVISSGPWLVSILGVLLVGLLTVDRVRRPAEVTAFQVSVTYLFAFSLIFTGLLQFLYTRYVADRLFERRGDAVAPSLMGALFVVTTSAGLAATLLASLLFGGTSLAYRVLMVVGFVTMSDIWIVVILLTGLKAYRQVVAAFVLAYGVVLGGAWLAVDWGLEGLLLAFVVGQALLLFVLLAAVLGEYASDTLVGFGFLDGEQVFPDLAVTGLLYNLAVWVDKLAFWFHPGTGDRVIGPLHASVLYDVPIFLAYLTIVPGMAVFLVRVETDFAELYDTFYAMVREGAPLADIERTRDRLIETVRQGVYEILKVQGITLAVAFLFAPNVLAWLGISQHYLGLFYVDAVGVAAQVLFLSILNIIFYLDQRRLALGLCAAFALLNLSLTLATQALGPAYYGYGFTFSGILVVLFGLAALSRRLEHLVRETFMLQSVTR